MQKSLHVIERLYPAMEIKTVIAQPKHQPPQVESILGRRVQASFSFVSRASS
ncbi:hypothetical protein [Vulcanococcus sp.]|uniref:hypothetical protein n=1 Tax=Vulcanococcus sp. TaxID=2856995 RepID=UPI003F6975FE